MEEYITGAGQRLEVHDEALCRGSHCVIHNPSNHSMRDFPTLWREDRKLMERTCVHGVGHPDPDAINFMPPEKRVWESVHGCDGCCRPNSETKEL